MGCVVHLLFLLHTMLRVFKCQCHQISIWFSLKSKKCDWSTGKSWFLQYIYNRTTTKLDKEISRSYIYRCRALSMQITRILNILCCKLRKLSWYPHAFRSLTFPISGINSKLLIISGMVTYNGHLVRRKWIAKAQNVNSAGKLYSHFSL